MLIIKKKEAIKKTIKILKDGGVVVFPTDTVYALLSDFKNKKAVNRIYKIKKRSKLKPLPVFVKDLNGAKILAEINPKTERFLKKIWPGKVTAVLRGKNGKNIGIRIPKYKMLNDLLKEFKDPIVQTSANISGEPATTRIKEIVSSFKDNKIKPDLMVDIGNLKASKTSKVIDFTGKKKRILRK